ncbi:hypothetical protein E2P81_ATG00811 [Venturia nashicola]|uniref:Uncharacterized protein n=1 Tax=Venturia nashicola TaxID=86259 RepID=A0A4Z1PK46_9PEZI|nr:hypothetical protein E6O75_ATG00829 [Venturia nashicola]TLD38268.1 hypothetical protein E2P81_ATG00811 [Venturia nashicola]
MSDKSYSDSEASDSTDITHEAKSNEVIKLVPVGLEKREIHMAGNRTIARSKNIASQLLRKKKPCGNSSNTSLDGKNLLGNSYDSSNVKPLFGKRKNSKYRLHDYENGIDSNAGYRSSAGDTTESEHFSGGSDGGSKHNTDDTSCTTLDNGLEDKGSGEYDSTDISENGDDDGILRNLAIGMSSENQNRTITHFWPLCPDGTEMTAQEYMDWKNRGFKFEYEPAAYRWDDGGEAVDREVLEKVETTGLDVVDRAFALELPSSCMNLENEGYDFESPFHPPFFTSDGFRSFMEE